MVGKKEERKERTKGGFEGRKDGGTFYLGAKIAFNFFNPAQQNHVFAVFAACFSEI